MYESGITERGEERRLFPSIYGPLSSRATRWADLLSEVYFNSMRERERESKILGIK